MNKRTLKGPNEGKIYSYFEANKICDYLNNDFLFFVRNSLPEFKGKPPRNEVDYSDFVTTVDDFVQIYDSWDEPISNICVAGFFQLMQTQALFPPKTSNRQKREVARQIFCYHLGMLALDS